MAQRKRVVSPFLRSGGNKNSMMLAVLACLSLTALHFTFRYDGQFIVRYAGYVAAALVLEVLYFLLRDGRFRVPQASTAVTAALLVLSVPSRMPWIQVGSGVLVAAMFGKWVVDSSALRVNPMLLGRLFMMLLFANSIQQWLIPGTTLDGFTTATPLGLYAAEGGTYSVARILIGDISGTWEGYVDMIPGSPGEVMPLLSLAFGVVLYFLGVLDWRPGVSFLIAFAATCAVLGMPVVYHVAAGSVIFTAVYIVTDLRSMPSSKAGRILGGLLAGLLNAVVRDWGYYPEGIVLAVLPVNLLSPALDRLAFHLRSRILTRRLKT